MVKFLGLNMLNVFSIFVLDFKNPSKLTWSSEYVNIKSCVSEYKSNIHTNIIVIAEDTIFLNNKLV